MEDPMYLMIHEIFGGLQRKRLVQLMLILRNKWTLVKMKFNDSSNENESWNSFCWISENCSSEVMYIVNELKEEYEIEDGEMGIIFKDPSDAVAYKLRWI